MTGANIGSTNYYGAPYLYPYTSQLLLILLAYPKQIRDKYIFLFASLDKWGMTEFIQCMALVVILNHKLNTSRVIRRNDDNLNLEDKESFIRYCLLQLSSLASLAKHCFGLCYNANNTIEVYEDCSITMYSSRG